MSYFVSLSPPGWPPGGCPLFAAPRPLCVPFCPCFWVPAGPPRPFRWEMCSPAQGAAVLSSGVMNVLRSYERSCGAPLHLQETLPLRSSVPIFMPCIHQELTCHPAKDNLFNLFPSPVLGSSCKDVLLNLFAAGSEHAH